MPQSYITRTGDTLWDIAVRFYGDGSLWATIYGTNRQTIGPDPATIHAGLNLTIPDLSGPTPPPPGAQTYVTKPGDTLWDLALRFYGDGTRWPTIYNANRAAIGPHPDQLRDGTTLTIPAAGGPAPVPPTGPAPRPIGGATITEAPAAVYYEGTRSFHALARSSSGTLVQNFAGRWEDLGAPAGGIGSGPGAVLRAPSSLHVAVCGNDTRLYHRFYDGRAWSGWENRGGDLASGPALASWNPGRLDMFAQGLFKNLIHSWWDVNTGWSTWEDLSPRMQARCDIQFAPSAVSWGPNRIDVFAVRTGDSHLVHAWWDGRSWQGWEDLGGVLTASPTVVSRRLNMLDVFGRGTDGQLYRQSWDGQRWSGWIGLGVTVASAPAAAVGPNAIALFARNNANQLVQI